MTSSGSWPQSKKYENGKSTALIRLTRRKARLVCVCVCECGGEERRRETMKQTERAF